MSETNSNMDSLVFVETGDNDVVSIVKSLDNLKIFDQLSQLDTSWKVTYIMLMMKMRRMLLLI